MFQYRGALSNVQLCSSRTPSGSAIWEWGCTWVSHPVDKQEWLSQAQHLAYVALPLPGLQLPLLWQRQWQLWYLTALTQHWLILICPNCSLIQVSEHLNTYPWHTFALKLLALSEMSCPGGDLDGWALSGQCRFWALGCSQCLFPSTQWQQWGALCSVGFWR